MLIRYKGGRSYYEIHYYRRKFSFTPENKYTLDITEQAVRDYIFMLPNSFEFEAVEREPVIPETVKSEPINEKPKDKFFGHRKNRLSDAT